MFLVYRRGVIISTADYHPPLPKRETGNFRGIVYFLLLISIKLSLKWALVETSTTKLMFPYLIAFIRVSGYFDGLRNSWELSFCPIFKMLVSKCLYGHRPLLTYTKKKIWGVYGGLSPLKPQNPLKFDFLTASSRLNYGKKIVKKLWNMFSINTDHF